MEEAMSRTGIHQFFFFVFVFFFSGFFFNTCMGCTASSPLIHPSVECWHRICGCMLGIS